MRLIHTLAEAKKAEQGTWALADAFLLDMKEGSIDNPTPSDFKEASEKLAESGFVYEPATVAKWWKVTTVFVPRKRGASFWIYDEIQAALWSELPKEDRANLLREYAAAYFAQEAGVPSHRKARVFAAGQKKALLAERRKREEQAAKRKAQRELAQLEEVLQGHVDEERWDEAEALVPAINALRSRLKLALIKVERPSETSDGEVTEDEEATSSEQDSVAAVEQAKQEILYFVSRLALSVSALKGAWANNAHVLRVTEDDSDLARSAKEEAVEHIEVDLLRVQTSLGEATSKITDTDSFDDAAFEAWRLEAESR